MLNKLHNNLFLEHSAYTTSITLLVWLCLITSKYHSWFSSIQFWDLIGTNKSWNQEIISFLRQVGATIWTKSYMALFEWRMSVYVRKNCLRHILLPIPSSSYYVKTNKIMVFVPGIILSIDVSFVKLKQNYIIWFEYKSFYND